MILLVAFGGEVFATEAALEPFLARVYLDVVDQTAFVFENLPAHFKWALVAVCVTQQLQLVFAV